MAMFGDMKESVQNHIDVALRLTRQMFLNEAEGSNAIFSPLAFHVLLCMLTAGSRGANQERNLLSFLKAKAPADLHSFAFDVVTDLFVTNAAGNEDLKLTSSTGVWINESLDVTPAFRTVLEGTYKANVKSVNFRTKHKEVWKEVNAWAEKETNGLIKEAVPPGQVTGWTMLIIANVLYFKAAWLDEFDKSLTNDDDFHRLDGSFIRASFMNKSYRKTAISVEDGFKILSMPYKMGKGVKYAFDMHILLPDERDGLPALVERACTEPGFLEKYKPRYKEELRKLRIPKFKMTFGLGASELLSKLGLELTGLTEYVYQNPEGRIPVPIPDVIHKAAIEVDEGGTEAAAFAEETDDDMGFSLEGEDEPQPELIDFIADHPFLYFIRERMTGIVLFAGQVVDPLQEDFSNFEKTRQFRMIDMNFEEHIKNYSEEKRRAEDVDADAASLDK